MAGSMERAASTITSEFDPEAFFVGIFLKGHQTREDYFCLGKDSIQKFKDNNIFNLQRATNLTEEQLSQRKHASIPTPAGALPATTFDCQLFRRPWHRARPRLYLLF